MWPSVAPRKCTHSTSLNTRPPPSSLLQQPQCPSPAQDGEWRVWGAMGCSPCRGSGNTLPPPCTPSLPVLQLLRHALGDAAAQQAHEEEQHHAHRQHAQDVGLGRRRENLPGQVGETFCWRHLLRTEKQHCARETSLKPTFSVHCVRLVSVTRANCITTYG